MTQYGTTTHRYAPDTDRGVDWRDLGLCRNSDEPNLWHAVGRDAQAQADTEFAKEICGRCPSLLPCRQWAIDRGEEGVWGGLDDDERRAIKRREARARERERERARKAAAAA